MRLIVMEGDMQRFHGTAARQLVLIDRVEGAGFTVHGARSFKAPAVPNIRLLQKDMYAELTRRRRRAQIAARQLLRKDS